MTTVAELLDAPNLSLTLVAGEAGLDRRLSTSELNRPSLELTGHFDSFKAERVQVLGKGEVHYIETLACEGGLVDNLCRIIADPVPCVIVTNDAEPPSCVRERAEAVAIPVLRCPHHTTKLYKRLWEHLDREFAPETNIHGVLLDVHDEGVLILGESAVGKSECALELIRRGFRLVADDMVLVKCLGDSQLVGRATDILPYHMEVRGMGIIDVRQLFGVTAIRPEKRISLAITLREWDQASASAYDRTGLDDHTIRILDVEIPHVTLPVRPARNVGTLIEVATLNHILKSLGINTPALAAEALRAQMDRDG